MGRGGGRQGCQLLRGCAGYSGWQAGSGRSVQGVLPDGCTEVLAWCQCFRSLCPCHVLG